MFDDSILNKSNQSWKLSIGMFISIIASIAVLYMAFNTKNYTPAQFLMMFAGCIVLMVGSIVWQAYSIRCSRCREKWFLIAIARQKSSRWLTWLLSQTQCPNCGAKE